MERHDAEGSGLQASVPKAFLGASRYTEGSLLQAVLAKAARHPVPDTHSDSLSEIGYGYAAYTQPQHLFQFAEYVLGRPTFDARIAEYVRRWRYAHPGPSDLQDALGGQELAWLFDDLLLDNKVPDYALTDVKRDGGLLSLTVENKGTAASPLLLAYRMPDGAYVESVTLPGFLGEQNFQLSAPAEANLLAVDPLLRSPEVDRNDNYRKIDGGPGARP